MAGVSTTPELLEGVVHRLLSRAATSSTLAPVIPQHTTWRSCDPEEDYIQLVRTVKIEPENSMDLGETVPSVCSGTSATFSANGSGVSDVRAEEVLHMQEEDHLAVALPAVRAADKEKMDTVTAQGAENCIKIEPEGGQHGSTFIGLQRSSPRSTQTPTATQVVTVKTLRGH